MGKFFSDAVELGIEKVWMSYEPDEIREGFRLFLNSAKKGDADAFCFLGRCYLGEQYVEMVGFPEDENLAIDYIKESVIRGSAVGVLCAMRCGAMTPAIHQKMPFKDLKEAYDIVLAKAEAGHPFCQYVIANTYYWGDQILIQGKEKMFERFPNEKSYDKWAYPIAIDWFIKAFNNGFIFGVRNLINIYNNEEGDIPPNKFIAEQWRKTAAVYGDSAQIFNMGCIYSQQDLEKKSIHFFKILAKRDYSPALASLGFNYHNGIGVEENWQTALIYYRKAANLGLASAKSNIGIIYATGNEFIPKDYAKAVYYHQESLSEEHTFSYPILPIYYQEGWGTLVDRDYAFYLLSKAKEYVDDFNNYQEEFFYTALGNAYCFGWGTDKNIAKGKDYYKKALKLGKIHSEYIKEKLKLLNN